MSNPMLQHVEIPEQYLLPGNKVAIRFNWNIDGLPYRKGDLTARHKDDEELRRLLLLKLKPKNQGEAPRPAVSLYRPNEAELKQLEAIESLKQGNPTPTDNSGLMRENAELRDRLARLEALVLGEAKDADTAEAEPKQEAPESKPEEPEQPKPRAPKRPAKRDRLAQ